MSKILTGLVGSAVVAGGLFYFGSAKLIADEINNQIATLQANGFVIENRVQDSSGDHFVISLEDMHKFSKLMPEYESVLLAEDKSALKEFKLGVDMTTAGSQVSVELYPIAFPTNELSEDEKDMIDRYIKEKTLSLHLEYNTATNNFEGTLKDIDEQVKEVAVRLAGLTFSGNINDDKIALNYSLNAFKIADNQGVKSVVELSGLSSQGTYEGFNYYVANTATSVDKFLINTPDDMGHVEFSGINISVNSDVEDELLESRLSLVSKSVDLNIKNDNYKWDTFTVDYGMKNINLQAFEELVTALDKQNPNFKSPEIEKHIEKIFATGVVLDIYKIGIENITHNGETLKGFSVQTNINFDSDPDIFKKLETTPQAALSAIKLNSKVEISDEIFAKAVQDPRAMMAMAIQPKQENGYKIYDIELKESKLTINDQPIM